MWVVGFEVGAEGAEGADTGEGAGGGERLGFTV